MSWRRLLVTMGACGALLLSTVGSAHAEAASLSTRAEFVTELAQALHVTPMTGGEASFTDVATSNPDYGYIQAAAKLGWVVGFPGGSFQPASPLTRQQMAKILVLAVGLGPEAQTTTSSATFSDAATIASWASGYVAVAQSSRLLVGLPTGSFAPTADLTVAQAQSAVNQAVAYLSSQLGNIMSLGATFVVASTVSPTNGDLNPYGITFDSFAGTSAAPNPLHGDLLVSNFSSSVGTNGLGSTIEAINPVTGAVTPFVSSAAGPVGLAVSPKGPVWVANFGTLGTNGNVQVFTPSGGAFPNGGGVITSPNLDGPWGQAFVPGATPAFLVTNVLNGTIDAMYGFAPPNFNTDTQFLEIGSGLATNHDAANPAGPQGMVYDAATGTIYVTDTADNSIRAFTWSGPTTSDQGTGTLVYQGGALQSPVGITIDPLNGDLLVVNQGNNNLVEISLKGPSAAVVGQQVLDHTAVNPNTGAGSGLFGVYALVTPAGALQVFYTDDNTNTVNVLR